jgi:hypothetical protein
MDESGLEIPREGKESSWLSQMIQAESDEETRYTEAKKAANKKQTAGRSRSETHGWDG